MFWDLVGLKARSEEGAVARSRPSLAVEGLRLLVGLRSTVTLENVQ
jgi:hypothetical protein